MRDAPSLAKGLYSGVTNSETGNLVSCENRSTKAIEEAVDEAIKRPPPPTVRAYEEVYRGLSADSVKIQRPPAPRFGRNVRVSVWTRRGRKTNRARKPIRWHDTA